MWKTITNNFPVRFPHQHPNFCQQHYPSFSHSRSNNETSSPVDTSGNCGYPHTLVTDGRQRTPPATETEKPGYLFLQPPLPARILPTSKVWPIGSPGLRLWSELNRNNYGDGGTFSQAVAVSASPGETMAAIESSTQCLWCKLRKQCPYWVRSMVTFQLLFWYAASSSWIFVNPGSPASLANL